MKTFLLLASALATSTAAYAADLEVTDLPRIHAEYKANQARWAREFLDKTFAGTMTLGNVSNVLGNDHFMVTFLEGSSDWLPGVATSPSRERIMLKATNEEIDEVREYFEWQAPDLEVTFLQKVYSEAVLNTRHDVWDIHTNADRWWVITGGTNLYSQDQFPNMDLALTFHIGLMLRIPRTEEQQENDLRIVPFGPVFQKMEEAGAAVTQAHNLADYQAVGVRCREMLLELIGVAQDAATWTDTPLSARTFASGWRSSATIFCRAILTKRVAEPLRVRLIPHGHFPTGSPTQSRPPGLMRTWRTR
jgi:hypothetical protein